MNQKGGCGKSSTCFHLAGGFAANGQRVLLVDLDPQASLSQGFFGPTQVESLSAHETMAALLDDLEFFSDHDALIQATPFQSVSICASNHHLSPYNTPCPENVGVQQYDLREFIESIADVDLVLLDCPPNLYRATWLAMVAADFVLIPLNPEDFGAQGLRAVHHAITHARKLNSSLRLLGHLITRSDRRLVIHRTYEVKLRELYAESIFTTVLPEASAFKVSLSCRQPVEYYAPRSRAAYLTRQLVREILDRITVETDATTRRRGNG